MYGVQCSQEILKDLFQLLTEAMGDQRGLGGGSWEIINVAKFLGLID